MSLWIRQFLLAYSKGHLIEYSDWGETSLYFQSEDVYIIPLIIYSWSKYNNPAEKFAKYNLLPEYNRTKNYLPFGVWFEIHKSRDVYLFRNIKLGFFPSDGNNDSLPLLVALPSGKINLNLFFLTPDKKKVMCVNIGEVGKLEDYDVRIYTEKDLIKVITPLATLSINKKNRKVFVSHENSILCSLFQVAPNVLHIKNIHTVYRSNTEIEAQRYSFCKYFLSQNDKVIFKSKDFLTLPNCFITNRFFLSNHDIVAKAAILFNLIIAKNAWFNLWPYLVLESDILDFGLFFWTTVKAGGLYVSGFLLISNYRVYKKPIYIRKSATNRVEIVCPQKKYILVKRALEKFNPVSVCGIIRFFVNINTTNSFSKMIKMIQSEVGSKIVIIHESLVLEHFFIKSHRKKYILSIASNSQIVDNLKYVYNIFADNISKCIKCMREAKNINILKGEPDSFLALLVEVEDIAADNFFRKIIWTKGKINFIKGDTMFDNIQTIIKKEVDNDANVEVL